MEGYIGRILFALSKLGVIPVDAANDPWGPALTPPRLDNITNVLNSPERASRIMFSFVSGHPEIDSSDRASLVRDYERFRAGLPDDLEDYVREQYQIDLSH